ncbi:MAG: amidohydrolase [Planctomycetaceae bacterium]|jgi:predicted amidohydrolase YtcJ|nr:amidohydrolase [Planctomycetaceae bacterium]
MIRLQTLIPVFLLLAAPEVLIAAEKADLVLLGGRIVTLDDACPTAEALTCRDGRVLAVGAKADVSKHIGPNTRVLDIAGKTAYPGFIEGHGHFLGLGESRMILDLSKVANWQELVDKVRQAAEKRPAGQWILGRGWHQAKWNPPVEPNVEGYPIHTDLSRAVPDHPVLLTHGTGHMSLANAKAMELAGVGPETKAPDGGEILRDAAGNPTGVFRETAQSLLERVAGGALETDEQIEEAIRLASEECLRKGITSFCDAGSSLALIDRYRRLAESGRLPVRLWVMISAGNEQLAKRLPEYRLIGVGDDSLTVRAIKRFIDGALGSHGAWLLEPYNDLPDSRGLQLSSLEVLRETARLAAEHDFQLCTHAIGDRANREVLNLYEETFAKYPCDACRRWRIEHAQHLHPDDIPRFARLGVTATMQGNHCTSDGPFVVSRLGEKRAREGAYGWRSLLDAGATVINGTDTPVEDVDPLGSFYASVTRRLADGTPFFAEQCMTREEALRSYTLDAAWAAFEEDLKGSLAPGKLADVVVLSSDLLTCPEEEILSTRVEYTIVGGKIGYASQE